MNNICSNCGKEFELSTTQKYKIKKDPNYKCFCSKKCSNIYTGQLYSQRCSDTKPYLKCAYCEKEFKPAATDYVELKRHPNHKVFCCEKHKKLFLQQRHENSIQYIKEYKKEWYENNKEYFKVWTDKNREKLRELDRKRYPKIRVQKSKNRKCKKDFSPLQNGKFNLSRSESSKYVSFYSTANIKAKKSPYGERTSNRKGVCYNKATKNWTGYLKHSGILYRKVFSTEEEAIKYRIYLEDKYYTKKQLEIRNKSDEVI